MIDLFFVIFVFSRFFKIIRNCRIPCNDIEGENNWIAPFRMDSTTIISVSANSYYIRNLTDHCSDEYCVREHFGDDQLTYKGKDMFQASRFPCFTTVRQNKHYEKEGNENE